MRIALINPPFRALHAGVHQWVTVPPQGYGGIQWFVAHILEGLLELGHDVALLGAIGSDSRGGQVDIVDAETPDAIRRCLTRSGVDIVHDSSNDVAQLRDVELG